jgi:hypothetical protein
MSIGPSQVLHPPQISRDSDAQNQDVQILYSMNLRQISLGTCIQGENIRATKFRRATKFCHAVTKSQTFNYGEPLSQLVASQPRLFGVLVRPAAVVVEGCVSCTVAVPTPLDGCVSLRAAAGNLEWISDTSGPVSKWRRPPQDVSTSAW